VRFSNTCFEQSLVVPGKLGDMVILSDNIFDLKPKPFRNVKADAAIMTRKVV
jgi:predicted amidohydrolase YtcJ